MNSSQPPQAVQGRRNEITSDDNKNTIRNYIQVGTDVDRICHKPTYMAENLSSPHKGQVKILTALQCGTFNKQIES